MLHKLDKFNAFRITSIIKVQLAALQLCHVCNFMRAEKKTIQIYFILRSVVQLYSNVFEFRFILFFFFKL